MFCGLLFGVLLLLARRSVQATVSGSYKMIGCCGSLRSVSGFVPLHIPSVPRTGHVPSCHGLGLLCGAQQPSHHSGARCAAGFGGHLSYPKAHKGVWELCRKARLGDVPIKESFNGDVSLSPSRVA